MNIIMDTTIDKFCNELFGKSAEKPYSININFPIESQMKDIFKHLVKIFIEGIQQLFNKPVDELSIPQFLKLNEYFQSFGFTFILAINGETEIFSNNKLENELKTYNLEINTTKNKLLVNFDVYIECRTCTGIKLR